MNETGLAHISLFGIHWPLQGLGIRHSSRAEDDGAELKQDMIEDNFAWSGGKQWMPQA